MSKACKDPRHGEKDGWTLYAINLKKTVLSKAKFRKRNPHYVQGKPCVYVGLTVKTAVERFHVHLYSQGKRRQHSEWVRNYGKRVRENDCRKLEPMSRTAAEVEETKYADELRSKGWGVWEGGRNEGDSAAQIPDPIINEICYQF